MQILPVLQGAEQYGSIAGGLVDGVGRPDLGIRILESLRSTLRPDFISMFVHREDKPILLGHATLASAFDEERAIGNYLASHFREDPALHVIANDLSAGETIALYMRKSDVPTISYRRQCYEEPHIADRFSVARKTGFNEAVSINLYRGERSGPLEGDLNLALSLAPLLGATVARHCELTMSRNCRDPQHILLHLIERFPTLTMREAQCAADAIAGRTADETAGKLGIKVSSIVTHRKRAYERLEVAGLRALTMLYFAEG